MEQTTSRVFFGLKAVTLCAARLDSAYQHGRGASQAFVGGLLAHALEPAEMTDLTIALYGLSPRHTPTTQSLRAWEVEWFSTSLPPAPARVLVTAAGSGREVTGLRRLGYGVDAFEPAATLVSRIESAPSSLALQASHEDLIRASRGDTTSPAAPIAARRYDAVVLGWGSFTHVLDGDEQRSLLAACGALCPNGPILASFWAATATLHRGRSYAAGRRAGRGIASLRRGWGRRSAPRGPDREALGFAYNVGFTRRFSREDLDALAAGVGRTVTLFKLEPYAHATLEPQD